MLHWWFLLILILQSPKTGPKYLGVVEIGVGKATKYVAGIYDFAKCNSGPLKPGVQCVESTVRTVVGPLYQTIEGKPYEILLFVDKKVRVFVFVVCCWYISKQNVWITFAWMLTKRIILRLFVVVYVCFFVSYPVDLFLRKTIWMLLCLYDGRKVNQCLFLFVYMSRKVGLCFIIVLFLSRMIYFYADYSRSHDHSWCFGFS